MRFWLFGSMASLETSVLIECKNCGMAESKVVKIFK